jgi:heme-degrading monooxygenase HmoA
MIIICLSLKDDADDLPAFQEAFRKAIPYMKRQKGFCSASLLTPVNEGRYHAMSFWETLEDYQQWLESEDIYEVYRSFCLNRLQKGQAHNNVLLEIFTLEVLAEKLCVFS